MDNDEDLNLMFCEDPVFQAINLLNVHVLPPPPQVCSKIDQLTGSEEDPIAKLIEQLERDKSGKDAEIGRLSGELGTERKRRMETEEKLGKLVEFITFVHGEVGKLITSLVSLTTRNVSVLNVLNVGPFHDEREAVEFLEMLKDLSKQFQNDFENSGSKQDLLERANYFILKAKPSPVPSSSVVEEKEGNLETELESKSPRTHDNPLETDSSISNERLSSAPTPVILDSEIVDLIGDIPPPTPDLTVSGGVLEEQLKGKIRRRHGNMTFPVQGEGSLELNCVNRRHGVDRSRRHWGFYCLCGSKLSSNSCLTFHIKYFTCERQFKCEICGQKFFVGSHLRTHMFSRHKIIDLGTGDFNCSQCAQEFQSRKDLWQHKVTCTGSGNANNTTRGDIQQDKGKAVKHLNLTADHGNHGVDPNSSENACLCGKKYTHKSTLAAHLNSVTFGKVFRCSVCPESYLTHWRLKHHYKSEHGIEYQEAKFGCSRCGETFQKMSALNKHRAIKHGPRKRRRCNRNLPKLSSATTITTSVNPNVAIAVNASAEVDHQMTTVLPPSACSPTNLSSAHQNLLNPDDDIICID